MADIRVRRDYDWLGRKWKLIELSREYKINDRMLYQRLRKNNWQVTEKLLNPKKLVQGAGNGKKTDDLTIAKIQSLTGNSRYWIEKELSRGATFEQLAYGVFGGTRSKLSMLDAWKMAFNALPVGVMSCNCKLM